MITRDVSQIEITKINNGFVISHHGQMKELGKQSIPFQQVDYHKEKEDVIKAVEELLK